MISGVMCKGKKSLHLKLVQKRERGKGSATEVYQRMYTHLIALNCSSIAPLIQVQFDCSKYFEYMAN